jgi:hypothetical protein
MAGKTRRSQDAKRVTSPAGRAVAYGFPSLPKQLKRVLLEVLNEHDARIAFDAVVAGIFGGDALRREGL